VVVPAKSRAATERQAGHMDLLLRSQTDLE
jgi:hypothetical protein